MKLGMLSWIVVIGLLVTVPQVFAGETLSNQNGTKATEVNFTIATKFPHVPGPITRSKKWTFPMSVNSATIVADSCDSTPHCKNVELTIADNFVYVTAKFQAQWDTNVSVRGMFVATFESSDATKNLAASKPEGEITSNPQTNCKGLTSKGEGYREKNCKAISGIYGYCKEAKKNGDKSFKTPNACYNIIK
jgi:hypothetical protein